MTAVSALSARGLSGRGGRAARRRLVNRLVCASLGLCLLLGLIPLAAVIVYTVGRGLSHISVGFLTHSMRVVGPLDTTGGIYHSIVGTLEQVLLAGVISVPLGLLVAVYLVEYGGRSRFASIVRFTTDVMTGVPSIVAGLFVYAFWVLGLHQGYSGLAAAISLAVLMLPVVTRGSEEMLKLVSPDLREASFALGVPRWRTILLVVLPTAASGLTTAVMLAVARVTGETAPLLLTAFGSNDVHYNPVRGAQSALPLFVYSQASSPFKVDVSRAWAAALTLIVIVILLTVVARIITRRNRVSVT